MSRILRSLSLILCIVTSASAQNYKAGKIVFKNPGPYDQPALEAAVGLHAGSALTNAGLQKAAQALMDTGLFEDAQATLEGNISAVNVIFILKTGDTTHFLPVRFDNFPWWSQEELVAAVRQTVPLFHGSLPEAGNLGDSVETALQTLLAAKGIASAKVTHEAIEPSTADPARSIAFSLASPTVHIHSVHLDGASPEMRATTDKIAADLANHPYNEAALTHALLEPLQDAGYLGASLASVKRAPVVFADGIAVDYTATVQPGELFHVASINFPGTELISSDAFAKSATLHAGDLVSLKKLQETLAPIDAAYHSQGYMNEAATATAVPEQTAHTVIYNVSVAAGPQYTLRSVKPIGLTAQQMTAFQAAWKLQPGAFYNPDYVKTFIKANVAQPAFRGTNIKYTATAQPDSHVVDLVITFSH